MWTVGHSTRSIDELASVVRSYDIELIADVRRFPGSRRLPQFTAPAFGELLATHHMGYCWLPALGGRRQPHRDSINLGWRHAAFRGYADHTGSEEFAEGVFELLMIAHGLRTAILCAEILWWRCHRRLIADVLTSLGITVLHIRDERASERHRLVAPARLVSGRLTYTLTDA